MVTQEIVEYGFAAAVCQGIVYFGDNQ